jgi:hypothetical protein
VTEEVSSFCCASRQEEDEEELYRASEGGTVGKVVLLYRWNSYQQMLGRRELLPENFTTHDAGSKGASRTLLVIVQAMNRHGLSARIHCNGIGTLNTIACCTIDDFAPDIAADGGGLKCGFSCTAEWMHSDWEFVREAKSSTRRC